jgi:crossover junction endodeoxyribonuclease RusA
MPTVIVPGHPIPKGRPRMAPSGNVYTDKRTRDYEKLVALETKRRIHTPLVGELEVAIRLYFKGRVFADLDNCQKALLDGMQGVAFTNDKQIRRITCERFTDPNERAEIEISEMREGIA